MNTPKKTTRLFSSPWLERLSRTHSLVPVSMFLVCAAALFLFSIRNAGVHVIATSALFVAGLVSFTWIEYQIHRRVFHLKPSTPARAKLQHTIHGVHHDFPDASATEYHYCYAFDTSFKIDSWKIFIRFFSWFLYRLRDLPARTLCSACVQAAKEQVKNFVEAPLHPSLQG